MICGGIAASGDLQRVRREGGKGSEAAGKAVDGEIKRESQQLRRPRRERQLFDACEFVASSEGGSARKSAANAGVAGLMQTCISQQSNRTHSG